jgi:heme A synthase
LTLLATAGQIVFGALVRHQHGPHAQRAHVLFAFAVVAVIVWLVRTVREGSHDGPVRQGATLLVGLVTIQVLLGVEAWLRRFAAGVPVDLMRPDATTDFVRSAHFFVGALLFAAAVSVNLLLYGPADIAATVKSPGLDSAFSEGGRIAAGIGSTL